MMVEVRELRDKVRTLEAASAGAAPMHPGFADDGVSAATTPQIRLDAVLLAFLVLIATHFIVIIQFDLPLIVLRVVSIGAPFTAGLVFRRDLETSLWRDAGVGVLLSGSAIFAMLAVVARVDSVPILPQTGTEWWEVVEYAASIALGFLAGSLTRLCVLLAREPKAATRGLLGAATHALVREIRGTKDKNSLDKQIKMVEAIITTGLALAVAFASVVTGLGKLLK
jgi:hypothetical protein